MAGRPLAITLYELGYSAEASQSKVNRPAAGKAFSYAAKQLANICKQPSKASHERWAVSACGYVWCHVSPKQLSPLLAQSRGWPAWHILLYAPMFQLDMNDPSGHSCKAGAYLQWR